MKHIILIIILLSCNFFASSQVELNKDPEAKKILDALAKKTKAFNSIRFKFDYTIENKQNGYKEKHKGYAFLKENRYKIIIPGTEIFSDGTTVWTYMKESNEITITEPGPDEESIFNPAKLFTIYESGYKYLLIGVEKINNSSYNVIDLFPEEIDESPYSKIRIKIHKNKNEIYAVETYEKSGLNHYLTVTEIKPDIKITEQLFVFDETKYPDDIEIIDMRF
ncbi:MAG: outer membrane lipoprotein carrier protein LolA [Bacteroidales bacterium]|nr:outer membrane lipoprotein carrier protein LolA [Bacteroidales bacterium]